MDLIDRNELLKHQHNIIEWDGLIQAIFLPVVDVADIKNAPTVEAEPVKHGKWKGWRKSAFHRLDKFGEPIYRDARYYSCNLCYYRTVIKSNYCPHCGAKMDLEGEENA